MSHPLVQADTQGVDVTTSWGRVIKTSSPSKPPQTHTQEACRPSAESCQVPLPS